ncbi:MAG: diguanylate cyclase [Spirochaetota bacterium]
MLDIHDPPLNPALNLRNRYVLALSLIALLIITSQIVIQLTIAWSDDDARVVNVAGRQRMLSQKISKVSLEILRAEGPALRVAPAAELAGAIKTWSESHDGLLSGSTTLGVKGRNSERILTLFASIEPAYREILDAASTLATRAIAVDLAPTELERLNARILARENEFLVGMNAITFQYDAETRGRLDLIRLLEYILLGVTVLTLSLEAIFIFVPAERQISRYFRDMKKAVEILRERATFDELSGVYNRATGLFLLAREMEKARRQKTGLCLGFIDLDGLKQVNDGYGHDAGDALISEFAALLQSTIRSEDAAFRYGGDEFAVILSCDLARANSVIERLRNLAEQRNSKKDRPWGIAFSCGLTEFDPGRELSMEELIALADEVMYREKQAHKSAGTSPSR